MKTVKAFVIPPNGDFSVVSLSCLEDYQKHVGGFIEVAYPLPGSIASGASETPDCAGNPVVYINEEGSLLGLPYNPIASLFLGFGVVGTVLVVGPTDSEGNDTDVPDWVIGVE